MDREYPPVTPRRALPTKILVVDSDPMIGRLCQNQLKRHNISVLTAQDLGTALYHFNQNKLDVALGKLANAMDCLNKSLLIDPFFEKAKIKLADLKAGDPNTSAIDS